MASFMEPPFVGTASVKVDTCLAVVEGTSFKVVATSTWASAEVAASRITPWGRIKAWVIASITTVVHKRVALV